MTNHGAAESMRVRARRMREVWVHFVIAHEIKDEILSEAEGLEVEADALERNEKFTAKEEHERETPRCTSTEGDDRCELDARHAGEHKANGRAEREDAMCAEATKEITRKVRLP